jgi:uncharacterized protein
MNRSFKAAVASLMLAVGFAGSVAAGPFEDATAAYKKGDYATALRLWRPLADQGNANAQGHLGSMYALGLGVPENDAAAVGWFRKAADQGDAFAQRALGSHYRYGSGVSRDYGAAVSWYRKAADQGDAFAQSDLALMYFNGQGVPKDYAAALSWARRAADRGNVSALVDLGFDAYKSGDYATALKLLRPLADKGFPIPQFYLGLMYANGQGVPRNDAEAVSWYRKAADKDYSAAQNNLGNMYLNGQGVPQDYATAVEWYRKAADHHNATAQNNLGRMYANGQGVPQDYVSAHMWFNLATARGDKAGATNRDWVAARMTPAQTAEAQKRAAEWQAEAANAAPAQAAQGRVPLKMDGGTFVVPVQINGTMTLDFIIDSGAADVSVPADVVSTLMRAGAIREPDFIGENTYVLADGSKTKSPTFTIRTLKVGNTVLDNVRGSVASSQGSLLLGQSFLARFKSWSIDNTKQELLLEPL